jgi:transketolase
MTSIAVSEPLTTQSQPFGYALAAVGHQHDDVVVLSADLAKYTDVAPFVEAFPNRFFQVGMAEQNMIGIAGGLARSGFTPFVTTYGVFATRRALDQVVNAIAIGRANVKVVAFLPGLTTPGGPTHQAIDDLAIMRAVPNMVVIDPADAVEISAATQAIASYRGPVYMRGLRGNVPVTFADGFSFEIGKARLVREGGDIGIITTGLMLATALKAADELRGRDLEAAILHVSTLKPFDEQAILALAREVPALVTVENHTVMGGLGSAVAMTLARVGLGRPVKMVGVQDVFAEAGSFEYLVQKYGLSAEHIVAAVIDLVDCRG